jgi:hypothetical protein
MSLFDLLDEFTLEYVLDMCMVHINTNDITHNETVKYKTDNSGWVCCYYKHKLISKEDINIYIETHYSLQLRCNEKLCANCKRKYRCNQFVDEVLDDRFKNLNEHKNIMILLNKIYKLYEQALALLRLSLVCKRWNNIIYPNMYCKITPKHTFNAQLFTTFIKLAYQFVPVVIMDSQKSLGYIDCMPGTTIKQIRNYLSITRHAPDIKLYYHGGPEMCYETRIMSLQYVYLSPHVMC